MDDRKYGSSRLAQIVIEDPNKCFVCNEYVPDNAPECPTCQFPQNGDEASQRWFLGNLRVKKRDKNLAGFAIDKTYGHIFSMPVTFFLLALIFWKNYYNLLYAEVCGLIGLTFLSISIFGRKKPRLAFAISLGVYSLLTIPLIIYNPKIILLSSFLILVPYIILFIGLRSYKDWEILDKEVGDKNSG